MSLVRQHALENLDTVGQLFYKLQLIPRIQTRLNLHIFAFKCFANISAVTHDLNLFLRCINEIIGVKSDIQKLFSFMIGMYNMCNVHIIVFIIY